MNPQEKEDAFWTLTSHQNVFTPLPSSLPDFYLFNRSQILSVGRWGGLEKN